MTDVGKGLTNRHNILKGSESTAQSDALVELGLKTSFKKLPARISLGNRSFYLVRGKSGFRLLSTICPHQGGEVANLGTYFGCPNHGWRFDLATGRCINIPNESLSSFPVFVRKGRLFAEVPFLSARSGSRPPRAKCLDQLTVQLHAHACLDIRYKGFSLLTDPWLCGPAFLGSWTHYPPPVVDVSTLRPDAIWISHEHSDHFHEPSLMWFDRSTTIYLSDFPNRRLVERLATLGFSNVYPMAFGETCNISENFKLTCFEPGSLWNDAIVLVEVDGFRLLNINDAGLNRRIAPQVAPVDAVASTFATGASSYPLAWSHLAEAEKIRIMEQACQGELKMLKEAMNLYGGKYLLPFASHFALWHPSHREYVRMMRRNTLDDVVQAFEESNIQVIDLLPGEAWNVATGCRDRLGYHRRQLYDRGHLLRHLQRCFDIHVFEEHHPASVDLDRDEVEAYFLRMNEIPEIAFCEDLTVMVRATGGNFDAADLQVSLRVAAGRLQIVKDPPPVPNLLVEIPSSILKRIVTGNLSWDEAHIGYWCRFTRSPDVYHAGFWRLLHAPYFNRLAEPPPVDHKPITTASVIADLIETYGDRAERVLRRYGLYCAGCCHSTSESIGLGARHHGVEEKQVNRLVRELNKIFYPVR